MVVRMSWKAASCPYSIKNDNHKKGRLTFCNVSSKVAVFAIRSQTFVVYVFISVFKSCIFSISLNSTSSDSRLVELARLRRNGFAFREQYGSFLQRYLIITPRNIESHLTEKSKWINIVLSGSRCCAVTPGQDGTDPLSR